MPWVLEAPQNSFPHICVCYGGSMKARCQVRSVAEKRLRSPLDFLFEPSRDGNPFEQQPQGLNPNQLRILGARIFSRSCPCLCNELQDSLQYPQVFQSILNSVNSGMQVLFEVFSSAQRVISEDLAANGLECSFFASEVSSDLWYRITCSRLFISCKVCCTWTV